MFSHDAANFKVEDEDGGTQYMIDAADPAKSNWIRYINSAMTENTTNMDSVQYNGEIYYEVNQAIPAGKRRHSCAMICACSFK